MGYYPFIMVVRITPEQRKMLEGDRTEEACDQIWKTCAEIIEKKKTPGVMGYRPKEEVEGCSMPYKNGIIPACRIPDTFFYILGLGKELQGKMLQFHRLCLEQHGIKVKNALMCNLANEEVAIHAGWLTRLKLGKIDPDIGLYDGEIMNGLVDEHRFWEYVKDAENYALCVAEILRPE